MTFAFADLKQFAQTEEKTLSASLLGMFNLFASTRELCEQYREMLGEHYASELKKAVVAYKKAAATATGVEEAMKKIAHVTRAALLYTKSVGTNDSDQPFL